MAKYAIVGVACGALALAGIDRGVMAGLAGGATIAAIITAIRLRSHGRT